MNFVYVFGLLDIRKSFSKAAYGISDRILKLTSVTDRDIYKMKVFTTPLFAPRRI